MYTHYYTGICGAGTTWTERLLYLLCFTVYPIALSILVCRFDFTEELHTLRL